MQFGGWRDFHLLEAIVQVVFNVVVFWPAFARHVKGHALQGVMPLKAIQHARLIQEAT
jgi:hypothetical protein